MSAIMLNVELGDQHSRTIEFLKENALNEVLEDDYIIHQRSGLSTAKDAYTVTERMILTIYVEIKLNIPFKRHQDMVNLQRLNGLNLGKLYIKMSQM